MIAHVDGSGYVDPTSGIQIDPTALDELGIPAPGPVRTGLIRRWIAIHRGVCDCGGELMMTNRQQRRTWRRMGIEAFDALVFHRGDCSAVSEKTRVWVYRNRRLAG